MKYLYSASCFDCIHTKLAHFGNGEIGNGRFWKRNSDRHILEMALCEHLQMVETEYHSTLLKRD